LRSHESGCSACIHGAMSSRKKKRIYSLRVIVLNAVFLVAVQNMFERIFLFFYLRIEAHEAWRSIRAEKGCFFPLFVQFDLSACLAFFFDDEYKIIQIFFLLDPDNFWSISVLEIHWKSKFKTRLIKCSANFRKLICFMDYLNKPYNAFFTRCNL
jgi:hypothetical protein